MWQDPPAPICEICETGGDAFDLDWNEDNTKHLICAPEEDSDDENQSE